MYLWMTASTAALGTPAATVHNCGEIIQEIVQTITTMTAWLDVSEVEFARRSNRKWKENFFGTSEWWQENLFQFVRFDARCVLGARKYQLVLGKAVLRLHQSRTIWMKWGNSKCVWMWSVAVAMATAYFYYFPSFHYGIYALRRDKSAKAKTTQSFVRSLSAAFAVCRRRTRKVSWIHRRCIT